MPSKDGRWIRHYSLDDKFSICGFALTRFMEVTYNVVMFLRPIDNLRFIICPTCLLIFKERGKQS